MNVLILGYGFSGYYCAKKLLVDGHQVTAVSRSYPKEYHLEKLQHVCGDMRSLDITTEPNAIIYCAPPPSQGTNDTLLAETLEALERNELIANIVYWGSSGVYGDHFGCWVDEESTCHVDFDIQRRRLNAEEQIQSFAKTHKVAWSIMRVAGMFGPGRMPKLSSPVVCLSEAPYSNLVYIEDAAYVATQAALQNESLGLFNVSDGIPKRKGTLQRIIAEHKEETLAELSYQEVMKTASPMMKYFLSSAKRLSNAKCQSLFPEFNFHSIEKAVEKCLEK